MLATALLAPLALAPPARAAVAVIVIEGEGFGHGVGMAQDGAFWMGEDGSSTAEILSHFYPGTGFGEGRGDVRVSVATPATAATVVRFPGGGEVRSPLEGDQAPGFPIRVEPGGSVRLRHDGSYRAELLGGATTRSASSPARIDLEPRAQQQQLPLPTSTTSSTTPPPSSTTTTRPLLPGPTSTTTAPPSTTSTTAGDGGGGGLLPTTTAPAPPPPTPDDPAPGDPAPPPPPVDPGAPSSATPLWAVPDGDGTTEVTERARRYRGVVEATAAGGPFRLLNHVDVEQYLRGMGEVRDARWSTASLGAQAVAARTYALRTVVAGGELCDTQRCQVYLGQQVEYAKMDEAVRATRGQVLTFGRSLAVTVYSANGGGVSATPEEGFGTVSASFPYLRAAPYTTRSPDPWRVEIAATDLGARLGYPGDLRGIAVARTGPSGRPTAVTLSGSGGDVEVGAIAVQRAAGLRSTRWGLRVEQAETAPAPPPVIDAVQDLPSAVVAASPERTATVARRPGRAVELAVPGDSTPGGAGRRAPSWAVPLLAGVVAATGLGGLITLAPIERARRPRPDGA